MANFPSNNAAFPHAQADSRSVFITRTYTHLVGGILGFILVELGLFESGLAVQIAQFMLGFNWFLILGAFMLTGWLASRTAQTSSSIGMQYFAYGAYVVAEALIFVPFAVYRRRKGARCNRQRHSGDGTGGRRTHGRRSSHPQGFLLPARVAHVGRYPGVGGDDRRRDLRLPARHLVLGGDDRVRRCGGAL